MQRWPASVGAEPGQIPDLPEGRPRSATATVLSIPGVETYTLVGAGIAANRLYHEPFYVTTPITIDQMVIDVTVAGAGGTRARLGVYTADKDWQPVNLVLDAGTVPVDAVALQTLAVTQNFSTGRYLKVLVSDGAPALRHVTGGSRYMGFNPVLGANAYVTQLYRAFAYATLPSPPSPWDTIVYASTGFLHKIFFQVNSP